MVRARMKCANGPLEKSRRRPIMGWMVAPKRCSKSPPPEYLWMWPLEIGSLQILLRISRWYHAGFSMDSKSGGWCRYMREVWLLFSWGRACKDEGRDGTSPITQNLWQPTGAKERHGTHAPSVPLEEKNAANTLISDWGEIIFLCLLELTKLAVIRCGSPRKLIRASNLDGRGRGTSIIKQFSVQETFQLRFGG